MKKSILIASVLMLLMACNSSNDNRYDEKEMEVESLDYSPPITKRSYTSSQKTSQKPILKDNVRVERKLIKTGNLTFETQDIQNTRMRIADLVKTNQGYMASDREYKSYDRISTTISLRIPSEKFDDFVTSLSKGVEKFDDKSIQISDVTEQFLDVSARLKTKKVLEIRYLEILKKAKSVREILDVERELGKLRADIESIEGRLKYLQNQVAFSTLTLTFYKKIAASESSFGGKIKEAFKDGYQNVKSFFLFTIKIWPFIIILFLLIFYFRRRISRKK
ncbi:MAG: DUF4349 domain-containing protein [Flavobacteriaceae bacterium]|nr:DUF4349 domain-containing protein [Flavobacteriaceae bacterium]